MPGAHQIRPQVLAAADQITQLLLFLAGDPDQPQIAGILNVTPYGGVGRVWVRSTPDGVPGLCRESFSQNKIFAGVNVFLGFNLAFEVDRTGDTTLRDPYNDHLWRLALADAAAGEGPTPTTPRPVVDAPTLAGRFRAAEERALTTRSTPALPDGARPDDDD